MDFNSLKGSDSKNKSTFFEITFNWISLGFSLGEKMYLKRELTPKNGHFPDAVFVSLKKQSYYCMKARKASVPK